MDDVIWWTAFGAIAQAAGALATACAVFVALWLARQERSLRGRGKAMIMMAAGPGYDPPEYLLMFQLENTGLRPLMWEAISWRSGWLPGIPGPLKHEWAIQSDERASPSISQTVHPAMTGKIFIPIRTMKEGRAEDEARYSMFDRRLPILGNAPLTALAHVAGRKPIKLKVSKSVREFMRTGAHPSYYQAG